MNKITVVEVCPQCGAENEMQWDFEQYGLNAFCPVCGSKMLLCDECMHRDEFKSDCANCKYDEDCTKRRYDHLTDGGPAYDVEITEVLKKTVSVNAYSVEVAELEAACRYKDGDYILDENDLESRTFTAVAKLSTPAE